MITQINNGKLHYNNQPKNQTFKGGGLNTLNFLSTSPAIGACCVDLCSMVIPRTAVDLKNRGPQAGTETGIREGSSCFLNASVGLLGTAAGAVVSKSFNDKFKFKSHDIYANSDTVDYCANLWKQSSSKKEYLKKFIGNMEGLDGTVWKSVPDDIAEDIANSLSSNSVSKDATKEAVSKITSSVSARSTFKIKDGTKMMSGSSATLLSNAKSLGDAFETVNISDTNLFDKFVSKLKNTKLKTTIAGVGLCAILCLSVQPLNKFFTKKRTGKDGFVGVNTPPDKSAKFKAEKTAVGLGMLAAMHSTIGNITKPREILEKIQFNGKFPTINQFKFLYGLTITSRLLASRDKNELREGLIKDSLGFSNWLIFGGMVSKLVARGLDKDLINNPVKNDTKKGLKYAASWITHSSVKNFEEILQPVSKKIAENGKVLSVGELYKAADKITKSKVMKAACSQIAGYLYTGLVLGVGIAKLNIAITNAITKRNKNKQNSLPEKSNIKQPDNMINYGVNRQTFSSIIV